MDTNDPLDLKLAVHATAGATYQCSDVLLARVRFNGTMELLTDAWETVLGYTADEFAGKTLAELMRSPAPEAVVAAILDERHRDPVDLTLRCRDGTAKRFRVHRRFDDYGRQVFLVAEETASSIALEPAAGEDPTAPAAKANGPSARAAR